MKASWLILGLILIGSASAARTTVDDILTGLEYNGAEGVAIFNITNPNNQPFALSKLTFHFNESTGRVTGYRVLINSTCSDTIPNYAERERCEPTINGTSCYNESYVASTNTKNYECYQSLPSVPPGKSKVRLEADLTFEQRPDNTYGYNIDWIPTIEFGGVNYTQSKWAWWNASYNNRTYINCTLINTGKTIVVNGTNKVFGTEVIWTKCRPELYLYFNNATSYAIANDTTTVPWQVENGTGQSYLPTQVWPNTSAVAVWEMNNATDYVGTATLRNLGAPGFAQAGKIGPGANISASGNFYAQPVYNWQGKNNGTISFWIKTSSTSVIPYSETYPLSCNTWYTWINTNGTIFAQGTAAHTSTGTVNNNNWNHVLFTYNATHKSWYINGVHDKTESSTATPANCAVRQHNIGHNNNVSTSNPVVGMMDQLVLSNKTFTQQDVTQEYNNHIGTAGYGTLGPVEINGGNDPCTYSGSGNWTVTQSCNITTAINLGRNTLILNGTSPIRFNVTGSVKNFSNIITIGQITLQGILG